MQFSLHSFLLYGTDVRMMSFSDRAQWEDVKHKTIFDVTFSIYDPRPFY